MEVHKSTICRELKRNSKKRSYNANFAIEVSTERRKETYKHSVFDMNMKRYIRDKLIAKQWSPEQIKGRCDLEGIAMVSVERIYQYIYWDQSQGGVLYKHLRTARRWRKKTYEHKTSKRTNTQ